MTELQVETSPIIRLGISACLMGKNVRYDGRHKRDAFLVETLGRFVEWVPVCPEVEIGMGTPRETIRLEGELEAPKLVAPKSGTDHTRAMQNWSKQRLSELEALDLHGFVLKRGSPSFGVFRVQVHQEGGGAPKTAGQGVFARALTKQWPLMPVEEEGRLSDPRRCESFIDRVFAWYRWCEFLALDPTPAGLVAFHTAYKMTLMSHDVVQYRALGRLVANAGNCSWSVLRDAYADAFMTTLTRLTTARKHVNVLHHLMGFIKKAIDRQAKQELLRVIEDYRQELVPLIVPLTLLKRHLAMHKTPDWVCRQVYLAPYPEELMQR